MLFSSIWDLGGAMIKNKNLLKKLEPKVKEAFAKLEKRFPDIERG
jgi:hypothetical protein